MSVKEFYNAISSQYDSLRFSNGYSWLIDGLEKQFILNHCRRGGKVLEVGAGTGRITAVLANYCRSVTVTDLSPDMLNVLRRKVAAKNLVVKNMSLFSIDKLDDFGDFDTVVCMRTLPHIEELDRALRLLRSSVKAGGNAIFDLWNRRSPYYLFRKATGSGGVFTRYMTPAEMLTAISNAGFHIEESIGIRYLKALNRLFNHVSARALPALYLVEKFGDTFLKPFAHSLVFNCAQERKKAYGFAPATRAPEHQWAVVQHARAARPINQAFRDWR